MPVTNVPAPGSPIRSNWAISVSNIANANEAALPGKFDKSGGTVSGALTVTGATTLAGLTAGTTNTGALTTTGKITSGGALESNGALTVGSGGSGGVTVANGNIIAGVNPSSGEGVLVGKDGSITQGYNTSGSAAATPCVELRRGPNAWTVGTLYLRFLTGAPPGTAIGSVSIASASSVAFNTTSDARLKEPTGDADDALAIVTELGAKAYRGRWIADQGAGDEWIFVNSQDVEPLLPFAVTGAADARTDDGAIEPQQLDAGSLVPVLLAAVSQLSARVAALEAAAA